MANSVKLKKALNIDDIYTSFKYQPLQIDDLDEFFVETDSARGGSPMRKRLARLLDREISDYQHILFVGYKGSGKSTELNQLQKDIQNNYLVVNYSVFRELDPVHINYIELFIVTLERLFTLAKDNNLDISQEYIDNITNWIRTKEIQEIKDKYIGADVEAGAEGKYGIPFLQNFFYKFRLSAKSSLSLKETIKRNIEPKLSDLIEHCNLLINEIKLQLKHVNKTDLLIIIEDLDKIPIDRADELFFNYANQLTQIKCNVVFTFPISSYFNIRFNTIRQSFDAIFELPMIMVMNRDQTDNSEGISKLTEIVGKRMEISLFENPKLLEMLIRKSGGCIRDLFRMVAEAAEHAIDYGNSIISQIDCEMGIQSLKKEYNNTIADNARNGKVIEVATYYNALVKVARDPDKQIDNTEEILDLRQNLCILGYNGTGWCDVHPIVKDILVEKGKWDGKQDSAGH
jgi:energy-coupling factor transporter ATP-binding protein EcfA2